MPLSAEDQAALESIISKILDKKLDGILTSKADTMAGEIREEMKSGMETLMKTGLDTFVKQQDVVNATFKTEVVDLKRRTKSLPMDGDMIGFVKTQVDRAQIVESLNLTNGGFEDTMDMSYGETVSDTYLVEGGARVSKPKTLAPGELKNSIWNFVGPAGTNNWLNFREDTFSTYEIALCENLPVIMDRYTYFEGLSDGSRDFVLENKWKIERQMKWNDNFVAFVQDWDTRMSFEDYFSIFWRSAKDNLLESPEIFKSVLFRKVMKARPDMLGLLAAPEKHATASALKYYLNLRRIVSPYADGETACKLFYDLKQKDGQAVDAYFRKKYMAFKNMYPSNVTVRQWRDFYDNVSKNLVHDGLAADMSRYGSECKNPANFGEFLNFLMKRGLHYISWTGRGGGDAKVNSCHTTASLENCIKEVGATDKITVHEMTATNVDHSTDVTPPNLVQNLEKMPLVGSNLLEFINSSEPILDDQMLNIVANLNRPVNGKVICWWCDKPSHTANDCFLKKQGKPPLPHSRFGKKDRNKQFVATNKGSDQIAQRSVNQIQFEHEMEQKKEEQMEYLISKGMDINQRYAHI